MVSCHIPVASGYLLSLQHYIKSMGCFTSRGWPVLRHIAEHVFMKSGMVEKLYWRLHHYHTYNLSKQLNFTVIKASQTRNLELKEQILAIMQSANTAANYLRVPFWGQISTPLGTWGQSCNFGDHSSLALTLSASD